MILVGPSSLYSSRVFEESLWSPRRRLRFRYERSSYRACRRVESASWSWEDAWPMVRKDSQKACSQMASVKEKEMNAIVVEAMELEGRDVGRRGLKHP